MKSEVYPVTPSARTNILNPLFAGCHCELLGRTESDIVSILLNYNKVYFDQTVLLSLLYTGKHLWMLGPLL